MAMDTTTTISLLALIASFLGMAVSYFVATNQVKIGLEEHERRAKHKTCLLLAERLETMTDFFFGAAMSIADVDLKQSDYDRAKLVLGLPRIDEEVIKFGIVERIAKSIDDYEEAGVLDHDRQSDIGHRLAKIRALIHRGLNHNVPCVWEILNECRGNNLASLLRQHYSRSNRFRWYS